MFKSEDGVQPKTATVKAGGAETETLPLYTNKSTVTGEVLSLLHSLPSSFQSVSHSYLSVAKSCGNMRPVPCETLACVGGVIQGWPGGMQVKVANIPGKKVEHQGIKVQLLGQIELASERGHPHTFISLGVPSCSMAWCRATSASALCRSRLGLRSSGCKRGDQGGSDSSPGVMLRCSERSGTPRRADSASDTPLRVCQRRDAV